MASFPSLPKVLALTWVKIVNKLTLLLLLVKAEHRMANTRGLGSPVYFSQQEKNVLEQNLVLWLKRLFYSLFTSF